MDFTNSIIDITSISAIIISASALYYSIRFNRNSDLQKTLKELNSKANTNSGDIKELRICVGNVTEKTTENCQRITNIENSSYNNPEVKRLENLINDLYDSVNVSMREEISSIKESVSHIKGQLSIITDRINIL